VGVRPEAGEQGRVVARDPVLRSPEN
jgi:hypothetical protein